ncbi:response regulator [Microvirga roseola]|uniref:response regulator n=1 Tax=Microvirga roseola TaxID=2883126 RepID=UPI001E3BB807|nr:response regulator [Microvirga roseola]
MRQRGIAAGLDGSEVNYYLPFRGNLTMAMRMNSNAALRTEPPSDLRRDPVVLVVEDELLVRMVLVDTLMDDGFEVIEATTGDEALLTLARRPDIGLIVSDVETPGLTNGFLLARTVAERRPDVRLIIVSGRAAPRASELPHGANFIAKPFYPETLLTLANAMLQRTRP